MPSPIRDVLADAMTYIRSQEANKAASSLTLDHLIQEQIDSLKPSSVTTYVDAHGTAVVSKRSRYDRLTALKESVSKAVAAVKAAGDDEGKLGALGLSGLDKETATLEDPSSSAQEAPT